MAWAWVNGASGHNFWQSTNGNGASGIAQIDSTGASSLFATIADADGTSTLSDSQGNTWVQGTVRGTSPRTAVWRCIAPSNSATLTFTVGATSKFPTLCVGAASGGDQTAPFDAEIGTTMGSVNTIQPGSLTPAATDELFIVGLARDGTASATSIDSSFTALEDHGIVGGQAYGGTLAYKIKVNATAENPTLSWAGGSQGGVSQAAFKPASGAAAASLVMRQNPLAAMIGR